MPLSADYLVDVSDIGGVLADLQKTSGTPDTDNNSQDDPYDVTDARCAHDDPDRATSATPRPAASAPSATRSGTISMATASATPASRASRASPSKLWVDVDGDGMLTPGVDNLMRTTATDISGEYEFKSLPFGDYLVNVTDD